MTAGGDGGPRSDIPELMVVIALLERIGDLRIARFDSVVIGIRGRYRP
jgi:hypothetical protein